MAGRLEFWVVTLGCLDICEGVYVIGSRGKGLRTCFWYISLAGHGVKKNCLFFGGCCSRSGQLLLLIE